MFSIHGLIPALFTPMTPDGALNLPQLAPLVDHLVTGGATALFIVGSAGEGVSLTVQERRAVVEETLNAVGGRIPVMVQVGHTSVTEARALAAHAHQCGAAAVSAILPSYFKPDSLDTLISILKDIASGAPDTPFYYYHIPALVNLSVNTLALMERAAEIPSLVGLKYSSVNVFEITALKYHFGDRYNILFGVDEMLLSGLVGGADGAVGSTYNFLLPVCNRVIEACGRSDLPAAMQAQSQATELIRIINGHGGLAAIKATMQFIGLDCGPVRLPLKPLSVEQTQELRKALLEAKFFDAVGLATTA